MRLEAANLTAARTLSHSTARRGGSPSRGEVGVDLVVMLEGPTVTIYKMAIFEAPAGVLNGRSSG